MQRVVQTIRQIARHEALQHTAVALGVVKRVFGTDDGNDYSCALDAPALGLAFPRVPIATGIVGAVSLPRENDLVVVVFPSHDLHNPVVIGRLYPRDTDPPAHAPGETVLSLPGGEAEAQKVLEVRVKTPGDGTRKATVTLEGSNVSVTCTIADQFVELKVQDVTVSLEQSGSGDGTLTLASGDTKITLSQGGDLTLETSGALKLKGGSVEINADSSVKVNGSTIDLN
jgi:hypothetical protein